MKNIRSFEELEDLIANEPILLAYFGSDACTVCRATKPKVEDLIKVMPTIQSCYCPSDYNPELSGQHLIFTIPAIIVFHHGHEIFRSARFLDLQYVKELLKDLIERTESTS